MSGGGDNETKVQGWKPAQKALKQDVLPGMRDYMQTYGDGSGLWADSQLADQRPMINDAQSMQLQLVPALSRHMDANTRVLEGFLNYDPNSPINQARMDSFSDAAMAEFNDSVRPAIESRSTFAGQYGGPQAALTMGRAAGDVGRDIASLQAQMMENDRNRAFQAMQVAPSLFMSRLLPSQVKEAVGQRKQARDQLELADQIQQFEAPRRNQLQSLMEGQQMIAPLTGTSTVTSGPGTSPLQGALAGAGIGSLFGAPGAFIGAGMGALGSFL